MTHEYPVYDGPLYDCVGSLYQRHGTSPIQLFKVVDETGTQLVIVPYRDVDKPVDKQWRTLVEPLDLFTEFGRIEEEDIPFLYLGDLSD